MTPDSKDKRMGGATERPWPSPEYQNDVGPDDDGFWEWYEIPGVGKFDKLEDAELIVTAVNAHESLVKALEDLLAMPCACTTDAEVTENARCRDRARSALSSLQGPKA